MTDIDLSKVKAGDTVTGTHEDFTAFGVARKGYTVTGEVYSGADGKLWVGHTTLSQLTITDHQPAEPVPGTVGTATVRGFEGLRVMRTDGNRGADYIWLSAVHVKGYRQHAGYMVTDFVPDDAEALRAEVEALRAEVEATTIKLLRAAVADREGLAKTIWESSRADEGTISAIGAQRVADAVARWLTGEES